MLTFVSFLYQFLFYKLFKPYAFGRIKVFAVSMEGFAVDQPSLFFTLGYVNSCISFISMYLRNNFWLTLYVFFVDLPF